MEPKTNPYRSSIIFQSWNAIYPVMIYFVVANVAMSLFAMLVTFLGADYQKQYMALQTAVAAISMPIIFRYYQKDKKEPTAFWERMGRKFARKTPVKVGLNGLMMFFAGAAAGMALNHAIALTSLKEISKGYQEAAGHFFAGGIFFELLGACLLTPCLEELLYRGVAYGRLCSLMAIKDGAKTEAGQKREKRSRLTAMAASALLFGAMHGNLVQFLYAGILGFLLAWFVEEAGHLYGAALAHIGANLTAVLCTETNLFGWMGQTEAMSLGATIALAFLTLLLLAAIYLQNRGN